MGWFFHKPKASPQIPKFDIDFHKGKEPEPRPEPMDVVEVRDPSESMIVRIKDMIRIKFK